MKKILYVISIVIIMVTLNIGIKTITVRNDSKKASNDEAAYNNVCDKIKNDKLNSISYSKFQKVSTTKDDYYFIKAAHECANKLNKPVYAEENAKYNIYNLNNEGSIKVKTNVDFKNSTFYIHDEKNIVTKKVSKTDIFEIVDDNKEIILSHDQISKIDIKKTTKNIPQLKGYGYSYVEVVNSNKKQFIRAGENANSGDDQQDYFKINNNGDVLNKIMWDFDNITDIIIRKIPSNTLTMKNGNFITIADTNASKSTKDYTRRGIFIKRSNTTLSNINHKVVNSNNKEIDSIDYNYRGFIIVDRICNFKLLDSNLYALETTHKGLNSTYGLFVSRTTNYRIMNVSIPERQINSSKYNHWGVVATHHTKDALFQRCNLNRVDSHAGVHNITINNCKIGKKGILLIGSGRALIQNTSVIGANSFINLRRDYGSMFDGKIIVENCQFTPLKQNEASLFIQFSFAYDDNNKVHDFGYDLALPNVQINGLKINTNNKKLFIYNNTQYATGTNGDLNKIKVNGNKLLNQPKTIDVSNVKNNNDENITVKSYSIDFNNAIKITGNVSKGSLTDFQKEKFKGKLDEYIKRIKTGEIEYDSKKRNIGKGPSNTYYLDSTSLVYNTFTNAFHVKMPTSSKYYFTSDFYNMKLSVIKNPKDMKSTNLEVGDVIAYRYKYNGKEHGNVGIYYSKNNIIFYNDKGITNYEINDFANHIISKNYIKFGVFRASKLYTLNNGI